jgi:rubrerythrin
VATVAKVPSPAIQLAAICERVKLVELAKRGRMDHLTGEEDEALRKAKRDLTWLAEREGAVAAAAEALYKEIRRIQARYDWECLECGCLFNHDEEMIEEEGLPTCPGCNSQDYEPN